MGAVEKTITQVVAERVDIGQAQRLLTQRFLIQSLLVLAVWGELLLVVVVLQMVRILFFLQSHLLAAAKVAPVVALPQVQAAALVVERVVILGLLVALVTRPLQAHHKVAMVGLALRHLGVLT